MKNVLIIEDITEVSQWLSDIVKESLHPEEIYFADSLEQAKDIILKKQFSLYLIDIGLPDGCGLEALDLIKTKNENCLCIITTIFDDSENLFSALKKGADGYILKSDDKHQIIEHLKGAAQGKPALSPSIAKKVLATFKLETSNEIKLSPREEQVLTLIAKGYNIPKVATLLDISHHTAADYLKQVYKKLHINNRADAALKAYEFGLIS